MKKEFSKIRLVYVKCNDQPSIYEDRLEEDLSVYSDKERFDVLVIAFRPLIVPKGMTLEDITNLVSYHYDDKELNLTEAGVLPLLQDELVNSGFEIDEKNNGVYYYSTYHYVPLKKYDLDYRVPELEDCLDLFMVDGNRNLFTKTSLNDRYFDWYKPDAKINDINNSNKR